MGSSLCSLPDWGGLAPLRFHSRSVGDRSAGPNDRTLRASAFLDPTGVRRSGIQPGLEGRMPSPPHSAGRMGPSLTSPANSLTFWGPVSTLILLRVRACLQAAIIPPLLKFLNIHSDTKITAISWEDQRQHAQLWWAEEV